MALCRAYTPGAGSGVRVAPAATRASARSFWPTRGVSRWRCVRTRAPSAAVTSRAPTTSNANTYSPKMMCATPVGLLSDRLAGSSPYGLP